MAEDSTDEVEGETTELQKFISTLKRLTPKCTLLGEPINTREMVRERIDTVNNFVTKNFIPAWKNLMGNPDGSMSFTAVRDAEEGFVDFYVDENGEKTPVEEVRRKYKVGEGTLSAVASLHRADFPVYTIVYEEPGKGTLTTELKMNRPEMGEEQDLQLSNVSEVIISFTDVKNDNKKEFFIRSGNGLSVQIDRDGLVDDTPQIFEEWYNLMAVFRSVSTAKD